MTTLQILHLVTVLAGTIGGKFADCLPVVLFASKVVVQVEAMNGLTGPQKLQQAHDLLIKGIDQYKIAPNLAGNPTPTKAVIEALVGVTAWS